MKIHYSGHQAHMVARICQWLHSFLVIVNTQIGVYLDMHGHNEVWMEYLDNFWFRWSISGQFGLLDWASRKFMASLVFAGLQQTPYQVYIPHPARGLFARIITSTEKRHTHVKLRVRPFQIQYYCLDRTASVPVINCSE